MRFVLRNYLFHLITLLFFLLALFCFLFSLGAETFSRDSFITSSVSLVVQNLSSYEYVPVSFRYVLYLEDEALFDEIKLIDLTDQPSSPLLDGAEQRIAISHDFYIPKNVPTEVYTFVVFVQRPGDAEEREVVRMPLRVVASSFSFPSFFYGFFFLFLAVLLLVVIFVRRRQ